MCMFIYSHSLIVILVLHRTFVIKVVQSTDGRNCFTAYDYTTEKVVNNDLSASNDRYEMKKGTAKGYCSRNKISQQDPFS